MNPEIQAYNERQELNDQAICDLLANEIDRGLRKAECKVWHAHPVWFLDGNPIVGYNKQKRGVRLMFWSGADFAEKDLNVIGPKFKDASIFYTDASEINVSALRRWLKTSIAIQLDYKNIVKRRGELVRIESR